MRLMTEGCSKKDMTFICPPHFEHFNAPIFQTFFRSTDEILHFARQTVRCYEMASGKLKSKSPASKTRHNGSQKGIFTVISELLNLEAPPAEPGEPYSISLNRSPQKSTQQIQNTPPLINNNKVPCCRELSGSHSNQIHTGSQVFQHHLMQPSQGRTDRVVGQYQIDRFIF